MRIARCLFLLAQVSLLAVGWNSTSAAGVQAPVLIFPNPRDFYKIITPGMDVSPSGRASAQIRQPTQLRAVVLGGQRALLWLETSVFKPGNSEQMGYRMAELSFVKPECAAREVSSMAGNGLQIKRTITPKAGFLSFALLAPEKTVRAGFVEQDSKFVELTKDPPSPLADEPRVREGPKDRRIQLLPIAASGDAGRKGPELFQQTISLRSTSDGQGIDFVGEFTLALGQYEMKLEKSVALSELGTTADGASLAARISKWLDAAAATASEDPTVLDNGKVCALWFKAADRILAVDLQRLQTVLLAKLLADEQKALTEYDFGSRDFLAASRILGHLMLAERIADQLGKNGGELGIAEKEGLVTAIRNARARLEELVFRLPVKVGDDDWIVFYKPDKRKARLFPDAVRWTSAAATDGSDLSAGKALQFKVPNRDLVFLMTVQATPSFTLGVEKIPGLQKELADRYQDEGLRTVRLETGIPDEFTATLALGAEDRQGLSSLAVSLCKRDARNRLLLKLTSRESEALSLLSLFLGAKGKGLPLDLNVDQFFIGRSHETAGAIIQGKVAVQDFQIVEARDQRIPVTVWVDAPVFVGAKSARVTVPFRYPGETATYSTTIDQSAGSGLVELPLKTVNGETVLDIEYQSPVNQAWILRERGVEGLVLVDK